jgi:hypothetical protein
MFESGAVAPLCMYTTGLHKPPILEKESTKKTFPLLLFLSLCCDFIFIPIVDYNRDRVPLKALFPLSYPWPAVDAVFNVKPLETISLNLRAFHSYPQLICIYKDRPWWSVCIAFARSV